MNLKNVTSTHAGPGPGPYHPDEWTGLGLCRDGELKALDAWFAPPGSPEAIQAAATCFICPVRLSCLAHAQARDEQWGIWGGEQFEIALCHNGLHAMTDDNSAHRGSSIKCLECERERSRRRKRRAA